MRSLTELEGAQSGFESVMSWSSIDAGLHPSLGGLWTAQRRSRYEKQIPAKRSVLAL